MPALCTIDYACVSVQKQGSLITDDPINCDNLGFDGILNGQSTDGKFIFTPTEAQYQDGTFPPGKYDVVISGTENKATSPETLTTTITFELVDPCDPPVSVSVGALENQGDYTPT